MFSNTETNRTNYCSSLKGRKKEQEVRSLYYSHVIDKTSQFISIGGKQE